MDIRTSQKNLYLGLVLFFLLVIFGFFSYIEIGTDNSEVRQTINLTEEQQRISHQIDTEGPQSAYDAYKERYAGYDFGTQHALAHIMGELLYQKEGIEGLTICDASFAFGCYHSFFGEAIRNEGTEIIEELDRTCIEAYGPLGTGCQHGIGHGIVEYMGRENLKEALLSCDKTSQPHPLFGCTSGVFMEYNFPIVITPDKIFNNVRKLNDQVYAPCTSVPERFQASCYYELPQLWMSEFGNNIPTLGELCSNLSVGTNQKNCFLGVGSTIVPAVKYSVERTISACDSILNSSGSLLCRSGAAWGFFINPTYRTQAAEVCRIGLDSFKHNQCVEESDLIKNGEIYEIHAI